MTGTCVTCGEQCMVRGLATMFPCAAWSDARSRGVPPGTVLLWKCSICGEAPPCGHPAGCNMRGFRVPDALVASFRY